MQRRGKKIADSRSVGARDTREAEVRIIGGTFRGRRLQYHGDPVVRPMKHRTREAIFNLISTECSGRHAIDLFAGTGALGLEALSRGAASATLIERHVPSARIVEANIRSLDVEARATLCVTSAFLWAKRDLAIAAIDDASAGKPWLVFCCPPYAFYRERQAEMLDLVRLIQTHAPTGSILIVEADEHFDFDLLLGGKSRSPHSGDWDVREYSPATIGVWRSN
ncbi:MAG TPA: RsmD family RNA methyltransferase [Lacipirellulaceae bacterium]|nr:RsmD family RNA methyltransferase [Lacipirellulaceae bacterium]